MRKTILLGTLSALLMSGVALQLGTATIAGAATSAAETAIVAPTPAAADLFAITGRDPAPRVIDRSTQNNINGDAAVRSVAHGSRRLRVGVVQHAHPIAHSRFDTASMAPVRNASCDSLLCSHYVLIGVGF